MKNRNILQSEVLYFKMQRYTILCNLPNLFYFIYIANFAPANNVRGSEGP